MMISPKLAPGIGIAFHHRSPAEFTAPKHQRVLEQPALLKVFDQRRARLIGVSGLILYPLIDFAVMVSSLMEKLHKPNPAFNEPARQQAVHRK